MKPLKGETLVSLLISLGLSALLLLLVAQFYAQTQQQNQRWCITAQVKNDHFCDCFHPQNCPKNLYAHFYYPYFEGKTMLIGPKLYPSEVAVKFNGARNTMETNCFMLQAGEHRTLFSFFNVGSIKLKSDQAASACTR